MTILTYSGANSIQYTLTMSLLIVSSVCVWDMHGEDLIRHSRDRISCGMALTCINYVYLLANCGHVYTIILHTHNNTHCLPIVVTSLMMV